MPDPRPEGFHFNKDGTITVIIGGDDPRQLRRPKTGAFKVYLLASRARDDELNAMRDAGTAETKVPDGKKLADLPLDEQAAIVDAAKEHNRQIADRQGELDRAWFRLVFNGTEETPALSDRALPEDDDEWPVWLWQPDNVTELIQHWRTAPLALGKR